VGLPCQKGSPWYSHSAAWGSEILTQQIADRFHLKHEEARRVKEEFGTLLETSADEERLPLSRRAQGTHTMKRGELRQFLSEKLDPFWRLLDQEVEALKQRGWPLPELVLSGGGAKLEGLLEKVEARYGIRTRLGVPRALNIKAHEGIECDTKYSALWGAVKRQSLLLQSENQSHFIQNPLLRVAGQAREWLETYF